MREMKTTREEQRKKPGLTFSNKLRYFALTLFILFGSGYDISNPTIRTEETKKSLTLSSAMLKRMFENNVVSNHYKWGGALKSIYNAQDYIPLWTKGFSFTPQAEKLLSFFENPKKFGLDSTDFSPHKIRQAMRWMHTEKQLDNLIEARVKTDLIISHAALTALIQLSEGVAFSRKNTYTPEEKSRIEALGKHLHILTSSAEAEDYMYTLHPDNPHLKRLLHALEIYLIKHSGGTRLITSTTCDSILLQAVRERYIQEGFFHADENINDSILQQATLRFQMRYGLSLSGKLDHQTCEALNKPVDYWFKKIALSIEKMKSDSMKHGPSILVNVPAYELYLIDTEKRMETYRVMVGTPGNPTPEITSEITKLVTNPHWVVPNSITQGELIQRIKKDSTFLTSRNFIIRDKNNNIIDQTSINWQEVTASSFEYVLQQQPGLGNAMGKIKFLFPNRHLVYLHDTPSQRLFANNYRAFSHGCVRIQNPQKLADKILSDLRRSEMYVTVKPLIKRGVTKEITLDHPLPVYLRYYTAFSVDGENIMFYDDLYNREKIQTNL